MTVDCVLVNVCCLSPSSWIPSLCGRRSSGGTLSLSSGVWGTRRRVEQTVAYGCVQGIWARERDLNVHNTLLCFRPQCARRSWHRLEEEGTTTIVCLVWLTWYVIWRLARALVLING